MYDSIASGSNADADVNNTSPDPFFPELNPDVPDSDLLIGETMAVADYETIVLNRLDVISVSCIISTCILFLLLLRSHR